MALRILFEVWAPGKDEFSAEFVGCRTCGLMIYTPRPTSEEIDAKYRYSVEMGSIAPSKEENIRRTRKRQERLYNLIVPRLSRPVRGARILDFGGGDGRLLKLFVEGQAECDIIDYNMNPVMGVRHIGKTEYDLPEESVYDLIVCSHVVEHLPEPMATLQKLVASLRPDGVIYVEVPVEVVGQLPARHEPVTHINFFTPESLASLMRNSGYRVLESALNNYPHPNGGWKLCAGVFASPGADTSIKDEGLAGLERYRHPSPLFRARIFKLVWRDYVSKIQRVILGRL